MTDHYDDDEDYYCSGVSHVVSRVLGTECGHLGNPRINCVTARESDLAMRVAELVAFDRGIKALQ